MSTIDRASLPQEFFDTTAARLLIQPEPEYIYARLWTDALMTSQPSLDSLGLGMSNRDKFGTSGAAYSTLEQQQLAVNDNIFRSAISVVAEVGQGPGHIVRLNRPAFTDSTYTMASRTLASGSTISTTGQAVSAQQVSMTLLRFGGPYAGGEVAPLSIEKFDAGLSLHKMVEIADLHIKRDFHKTIHRFIHSLFSLASNSVLPNGFASTSAFASAGDAPMSLDVLLDAEQTLKDAKIPRFPDGKYMIVMNPRQVRQLAGDPGYRQLAKYHKEFNTLFQGAYVATCEGFNIFESTDMPSSLGGVGGAIPYYTAHAFGPGMIGSGVGDPPKVRQNTNDNYGETALIVWLMYAAFQNLDARFGCVVYTD